MKKRVLSMLLAIVMMMGVLPAAVFAEGEGGEPATYGVTFAVENATFNGADTATAGVNYTAKLTANEGYTLPAELLLIINTVGATAGTDYTYNNTTGELTILGDKIDGAVEIRGNTISGSGDTPTPTTRSVSMMLKAVDTAGNKIEGLLDVQLNGGLLNGNSWIATAGHDYTTEFCVNIGENTLSNWDRCPEGYAKPTENVTFTVDSAGAITITSDNASVETSVGMNYIVITLQIDTTDDGTADDEPTYDVYMQLRYKDSSGLQFSDYCTASLSGTEQGLDTESPTGIIGLTAGDYTVSFNDAPFGYLVPADVTLTVGEDGALSISGANVELTTETVTDEYGTYEVYFLVVTLEADPSADQPGGSEDDEPVYMQLRYKDSAGLQFDDYCTASLSGTEQGLDTDSPTGIIGLTAGNYTITFNNVPSGYLVPEDVTLTVGEEGALSVSDENVQLVVEDVTYEGETYERVSFLVVTLEADSSADQPGGSGPDIPDDGSSGDTDDYIVVYFNNTVADWGEHVYAKQEGMYIHPTSVASNVYTFTVPDGVDLYFTNYMDTMPPDLFSGTYYISEKITPEADETYEYVGYDVTVATDVSHGTLTTQSYNFSISKASCGQSVTVVATPAEGYVLKSLSAKDADGNDVPVNADNTFTMPAQSVTVSATWEPLSFYIVLRASADADASTRYVLATYDQPLEMPTDVFSRSGYTVDYWSSKGDGSGSVRCGDGGTLEASDINFLFDHAYLDDQLGCYCFAYMTAQWKAVERFGVVLRASTAADAETKLVWANYGQPLDLSAYSFAPPNEGYTLSGWNSKGDGSGKVSCDVGGTISIDGVKILFDHAYIEEDGFYYFAYLTAQWEKTIFEAEILQPSGGKVETDNDSPTMGDKVTITVDPDPGKRVDKVVVQDENSDPVEVTKNPDGSYSYEQPAGNVTIEVTFENIPVYSEPTYRPIIEDTTGGDTTASHKNPEKGDKVTLTTNPDKGYEVGEIVVTDSKGNEVPVKDNGDGTYTYIQPAGKVTVTVIYKPIVCPSQAYSDLNTNAWYHEATDYVLANGLMNGVGNGKFAPNDTTSRAMIVTILWRLEGQPAVNCLMQFADVAAEAWYTEAVRWAASKKIVEGYGDTFGPNDPITREQFATILWRYAKYKGYDVSVGEDTNILSYEDAFSVSEYAIPAMQWACGAGLMQGDGVNLTPKANATRIQAAALFQRFCVNVK